MLTHIGNLFAFIGGLGMFLYGMDIMASGLQKTAGSKMKELLGEETVRSIRKNKYFRWAFWPEI